MIFPWFLLMELLSVIASKLEKEQRGKREHDPRLHVESLASRDQIKKERIQALLNKRKTRS